MTMQKTNLVINGNSKQVSAQNVAELLKELQLHQDAVVVELNKEIIHRNKYDDAQLTAQDNIEIVTVVGGG